MMEQQKTPQKLSFSVDVKSVEEHELWAVLSAGGTWEMSFEAEWLEQGTYSDGFSKSGPAGGDYCIIYAPPPSRNPFFFFILWSEHTKNTVTNVRLMDHFANMDGSISMIDVFWPLKHKRRAFNNSSEFRLVFCTWIQPLYDKQT